MIASYCMGVSINSTSSSKMRTKGANEIFINLLESYYMDEYFIQPFVSELRNTFQIMKAQTFEAKKDYE